jgi:putative ABC transport system permease protein
VLARQGPALAMQFHLAAAVFGIVLALCGLGLVATVDRQRRADDLRALRQQGLSQRTVRRAALWSYLSTVVAAMLTGLVAAAAAWWAAGDRLPIFTDALEVLPPPRWPEFGAVLVPWAWASAVMVMGSVVVAWALRRAVVTNGLDSVRSAVMARRPNPCRGRR